MKVSFNRKQLEAVSHAIADDIYCPNITCLRIEGARMIATDGHRLVIVDIEGDATSEETAHIPLPEVKRLLKMGGARSVYALESDPGELTTDRDGAPFVYRERMAVHIDGRASGHIGLDIVTFPDWVKVVPSADPVFTIGFNARYLREMADAAIRASGNPDACVRIDFTDPLGPAKWIACKYEKMPEGRTQKLASITGKSSMTGVLMPVRL